MFARTFPFFPSSTRVQSTAVRSCKSDSNGLGLRRLNLALERSFLVSQLGQFKPLEPRTFRAFEGRILRRPFDCCDECRGIALHFHHRSPDTCAEHEVRL